MAVDAIRLHFLAELREESPALGAVREVGGTLESEIQDAATRYLGPDFQVLHVEIRAGSVEILVYIAAAYVALSRYKNFTDSMSMLVSHIKSLIRRILKPYGIVDLQGSWSEGPDFPSNAAALPRATTLESYVPVLIWYLVLSNAALIAFCLWLLAKSHP